MKTLLYLIFLISGFLSFGQLKNVEVDFGYLTEFDVNGNKYGSLVELRKDIIQSGAYSLKGGLFEEFFVKRETDIEGISGNTLSNQIGFTVSNQWRILPSRKIYLMNTLYSGWGFRRTSASYVNDEFGIDRSIRSNGSYFALGMYWKVGYSLSPRLAIQLIGKTDFSRLIDQYEAVILENPGFMYGVGVKLNI